MIREGPAGPGFLSLVADDRPAEPLRNLPFDYRLGERRLYVGDGARLLFTNNETNNERLDGVPSRSLHVNTVASRPPHRIVEPNMSGRW